MHDRPEASKWSGLVATLVAVTIAAVLTYATPTPLPIKGALYALPLAAIVYASSSGRPWVAIVCATIGSVYALFHYDALDEIFSKRADRLLLGSTVVLVTFGMSLTALRMRRKQNVLRERAVRVERDHAATLERANAALTHANRTLDAFTYVVSHDLKEPARALGALTRSLQEDHAASFDAEARDLVARAAEASLRLETLLAGLLDYGRATQIQPHETQVIDVADVLRHSQCLTRYERVLTERGGELTVDAGPPVRASMTGMCQVVGNLVLNSLKHKPEGRASVRVGSRPNESEPSMVDVTVEDDGPGYPADLVEEFSVAKRGRPTTLRGGFGLIIAREASEKMGGQMTIRNAPNGGARTIITLPAGRAAVS